MFLHRDVIGVERVAEMVLRFDERCAREFQVSGEFLRPKATEPF